MICWIPHHTDTFKGNEPVAVQVPCIKMLIVAPLASVVHAGLSEAELIVTLRSEKHTNTTLTNPNAASCRQHDGQEAADEGMYEPPALFL